MRSAAVCNSLQVPPVCSRSKKETGRLLIGMMKQRLVTALSVIKPLLIENVSDRKLKMVLAKRQRRRMGRNYYYGDRLEGFSFPLLTHWFAQLNSQSQRSLPLTSLAAEIVWPLTWCVGAYSASAGRADHVTPWTYYDDNELLDMENESIKIYLLQFTSKSMRISVMMSSEHYQ